MLRTRSTARQEPPAQHDTNHGVPSAAPWFDPVRELVLKLILKTSPALNLRLRKLCGPFEAAVTGLAHLVSVTVTVEFMTICVPVLTVMASVAFAQQLLLLFSLVLICCNLAKNALRLPRPVRPGRQSRPLAELEQSYGFPSLHAAAALAIPMLAVSPTSPLVAALPEARLAGARAAALGWALLIGWARLHLGVHSLPDVLGGWALGLLVWRQFDAVLASGALEAAMASPWLAPCAAPLILLLALGLPKGRALPGQAGSLLCAWRQAQLPALVLPPLLPGLAGRDDALGVLLRVLAALVGTLLAKLLFKQVARRAVDVVGHVVGWPPSPAHADGTSARERCARLCSYTLLALVVFDVSPALVNPRAA